jgi:hypothetical protein
MHEQGHARDPARFGDQASCWAIFGQHRLGRVGAQEFNDASAVGPEKAGIDVLLPSFPYRPGQALQVASRWPRKVDLRKDGTAQAINVTRIVAKENGAGWRNVLNVVVYEGLGHRIEIGRCDSELRRHSYPTFL